MLHEDGSGVEEVEAAALRVLLGLRCGLGGDHADVAACSSRLGEARALRRTEPALLTAAPSVLAQISVYDVDETVRTTAAAYQDPLIRSLDAIHLATADAVLGDDLTAFVTYDRRLLATAKAMSLPTASPGLNLTNC